MDLASIYAVEADTLPVLTAYLTYSDGTPINLTGSSVLIHVRERAGTAMLVTGGTCQIVNGTAGVVQYSWLPSQLKDGDYFVEFQVNYGSNQLSVPTDAPLYLTIRKQLA
jgi:hypothetical protein